jgi:class 3 adenylate cyclase
VKGGEANEQTQGEPVDATVVSVIIRDFIHLTERLSATALTDLMSDYYEKVSLQIAQQQGKLTSISNHSMVVTFSAVDGADAHARRALHCALAIAMIAYQTRFWIRQAFPEQGLDKFGVGIGIASGELIFAEFGPPSRRQRVANGSAVAAASLLAVKSKDLGWNIVCSERSLQEAGKGVQVSRHELIGADWLKQPVAVAEVVVVRDGEEAFSESAPPDLLENTLPLSGEARSRRYLACLPEFPEIPGYKCLRLIGRGAMSHVFLVERLRDGVNLALKFADGSVSEDSEVLYRFVGEYGLLEQVRHPNVLHIYDQGVTDDALFIVMEYMPGGTLKQLIADKGVAPGYALRVLREMAWALATVHGMRIIHRDIKPENILLRNDGTAVLGDFGVARRLQKARHPDQMRYIVGTPYFMSPEQALGEDEEEYADIYSMGAVFYNMLTGEKPYQGESLEEIVQQHLHAPVPRLPDQFRHLQFLLDRMMSKEKIGRYSAATLQRILEELPVPSE